MGSRTTRHRDHRPGTLAGRAIIVAAAAAAVGLVAPAARAGQTGSSETVSLSGSTALKNWLVANTTTFTDVQPGKQLTVQGVTYPSDPSAWAVNGGQLLTYQLAPLNYNNGQTTYVGGSNESNSVAVVTPAYRFEFHESGSVEGILELANDQIAPVGYVTQNVNRNPNTGNAVWVNYNAFGGTTRPLPFNASTGGGDSGTGYHLGAFYNGNNAFTYGSSSNPTPTFNASGGNLNGGQNAVQVAVSDVVPIQAFASNATSSNGSVPAYMLAPGQAGYGQGNAALAAGATGVANARQTFQGTSSLNMAATAINPRTGQPFGAGAYNTAGLGNLNSQTVAVTASLFVANPGTGLTQVDRTDSQFLETTGRLANGALFNVTTRDVNSGTRNVTSLETGVDPTYSVGVNDNGNGNAPDGGLAQSTIGANLRFSNKTAGGGQLRPTVQASRMAVGTLSINDASGNTTNATANPLRALRYSDSTDGSAPYVLANYYTIAGVTNAAANPNGQQYTIFQNEQFVTVNAPNASGGTIQGDNAGGDVRSLLNNTLNSVAAYNSSSNTPASPAAGLLSQGYILPQLMAVTKAQNGLNQPGLPSQIVANPSYNASVASTPGFATLVGKLNSGDPSSVLAGTTSFYGGSSIAAGGVTAANATGGVGFVDQVPVTSSNGGTGGNYLFGNFNQTGVRDYDSAVVQAQKAQSALETSGAGTSGFGGSSNATVVNTGLSPLMSMANSAGGTGSTKGDLITLGDFNGDGVFDGRDLYLLATGASLTDPANRPTETTGNGATTFTTGHVSASASTFGAAIASSVLNKNTALDYLQANATAPQKAEAAAVLEAATAPSGGTTLGMDTESRLVRYTFDPSGGNAFNKSDVNQDGVVDLNDAVLVDKFNGYSYANLGNNLSATEQAPVTGTVQSANLVLVSQTDAGPTIGAADLAVVNTALTGTGNTNWYGYNLQKTGTGTITMARTAGTVTVYAGASLEVSGGTVQVAAGAQDPFSDNTTGTTTSGNHVALTLDNGGKVQLAGSGLTSTVAGLSIDTALGSQLDVGKNTAFVNYAGASPVTNIRTYLRSGYAGGQWTGPGIVSSSANATQFAVGYRDNGSSVQLKYTRYGDANLDGRVSSSDLATTQANFGTGTLWTQGDFNYDGRVGSADVALLRQNFGLTANAAVAPAATAPTPSVSLVVNTTTGDSQLVFSNASINLYEIYSPGGELLAGNLKSLQSQGYTGFAPTNTTIGNSNSDISETSNTATATLTTTVDLGNIFNTAFAAANLRDLDFSYNDQNNNNFDPATIQYVTTAAPEPTSLALVGVAVAGLLGGRRRRRQATTA